MKIKDIFSRRERGFALEFFPPKNREGKGPFLETVRQLTGHGPLYVSMTYGAGGTTQERTLSALAWLREEPGLPLMSHLTGIGASRDSIGTVARELKTLGVDNILALRGDPPKDASSRDPSKGDFPHARELIEFLGKTGDFSLAAAVYPEGHRESPNLAKDLEYTKQKIDAGADCAITQMFFENSHFYRFLDRAAKAGITVPIVPGIMPIFDCSRIKAFADVCNTSIPQAVLDRMEPVRDLPEEVRKIGVEFAVRQVQDLVQHGVRYIHFYTMNRADSVIEILQAAGRGLEEHPVAA